MTKEELEKEAKEWLCNNLHSASEEDFIKAMIDIVEPREKQIQIDAEQILALQKQNGELTDKVRELEIENEQIKNSDSLCKLIGEQKRKIAELEGQIEKMKCCGNCRCASHSSLDGTFCGRYTQYSKADDKCKYWEIR